MLAALEIAISDLLKATLPALFTGPHAAALAFPADTWTFDPLSLDPIAGQPGPEDAVDDLPFNPANPAGPYTLTRPPYPSPARVYLRSSEGELVPLSNSEVAWNPADAASFSLSLRPGRDTAGFDHVEILYTIMGASSKLKIVHELSLQITGSDDAASDTALSLALAVIALNRQSLMSSGNFSANSGNYQVQGTITKLKMVAGAATNAVRTVNLETEMDLRVERLLAEDEGKAIARVISPGKESGTRPVDLDIAVQA